MCNVALLYSFQESKHVPAETSSSSSSGHVLSAPDLQLDWVSDTSSDDDVQVLENEPNSVSTYQDFLCNSH